MGACALVLAATMAAPASSLAAKVLDWGGNSVGQLGNGTTTMSDVPVAVTGLGAVKKLAEDGQSAYAVLTNGTVDAWGDNQSGELGQGPSEPEQNESLVPEPVKGISGVTAIAAACHTAIARLSTGTVDVWGAGGGGQLAQGEKEESRALEPIPVASTRAHAPASHASDEIRLLRASSRLMIPPKAVR